MKFLLVLSMLFASVVVEDAAVRRLVMTAKGIAGLNRDLYELERSYGPATTRAAFM